MVELSPRGGVPDGAAEPGWCLFSGSAAVPVLSFPEQENHCSGTKSKTSWYQAGRAPLLPAHWLMPMVEMM